MKPIKWKPLALLLLALCLAFGPAYAERLTEEEMDQWYDLMQWLTEEIGTRQAWDPYIQQVEEQLADFYGECGFCQEDGTLLRVPAQGDFRGAALQTDNLVGTLYAANPDAPIVAVCAHYDSLTPGARDNSSGLAAMLTLMRHFAQQGPFENLELRFIAFTAEETGHQGSVAYVQQLTETEKQRMLAAINLDILVADTWETEMALSLDTLGMRTAEGYVQGSEQSPANNRASKALIWARSQQESYDPDELDITYCNARHMGQSDHESFHQVQVDAVNVCFRGTDDTGGQWPAEMHRNDVMGDFDLDRSYQALDMLERAIEGLAQNPRCGD